VKLVEVDVIRPEAFKAPISRHQHVSTPEGPRQDLGGDEDVGATGRMASPTISSVP